MEARTADRIGPTPRTSNGPKALGGDIRAVIDESPEAFIRPFELRSELIEGSVQRIAICGELDRATAPQLEAALRPDLDARFVLFDLSECGFIDLTGLALITGACRKVAADGTQFALCGASGQVERILDLTAARDSIAVFQSREQALASGPRKRRGIPVNGSSRRLPVPLPRLPQPVEIFDRGCKSAASTPWLHRKNELREEGLR